MEVFLTLNSYFSNFLEDSKKIPRRFWLVINILIIFFCSSIIVLSILVMPAATGHGTHESIGLPACLISKLSNSNNCPSCGLTTAITLIGKGRIRNAIFVHPWSISCYYLVLVLFGSSIVSLISKSVEMWLIPGSLIMIQGLMYTNYWLITLLT